MIIGINDKGCDTFNTPDYLFTQLNNIFSFTVDAACSSRNAKTDIRFAHDEGVCGLTESWERHRVFINPPFSKKKDWIIKAHNEVMENNCYVAVMILPLNCMSTETFFNIVIKNNYLYEILNKRVDFLDDATKNKTNGNNSDTVIVYFKKDISSKELVK